MNTSQQPEALRLADKYEAHGFLGNHRFAQEHWCRQAATELRSQHARILELEAVLSAMGEKGNPVKPADIPRATDKDTHFFLAGWNGRAAQVDPHEHFRNAAATAPAYPAEGATAQIETLRAELAEETEAAENWRRLALQFDHHRLQALGHIKAVVNPWTVFDAYKAAKAFLKAPPLDGEEVLAQRIAELAATPAAGELATLQAGLQAAAPNAPLYDPREVAFSAQPAPQAVQEAAVPVAGQSRFKGEKDWHWCSLEHVAMAAATPSELQVYEARYLYAHAAPAHPAGGVPAQAVELEVDDLIDRLLDAQQDLNLAANVHMDQSIASASTLLDKVEIALRTLSATHATQQGMEQPIKWPKARDVGRFGDMSPDGSIRVGLDADNDVYVSICDGTSVADIEFCTPGGGGGRSSRTRMALIALMCAIEADNASHPAFDFWQRNLAAQAKQGGM